MTQRLSTDNVCEKRPKESENAGGWITRQLFNFYKHKFMSLTPHVVVEM